MATATKAAKKSTTKKTAAKKSSAPLAHMAEKEPTALHVGFKDWLERQTGLTNLDLKSIQLATVLRMEYQRSDENQARLSASKQARADADAARAEKRAAKKTAKKAPASKTASKTAAKKAPATKKAAKKAPARRRATKATAGEESFE